MPKMSKARGDEREEASSAASGDGLSLERKMATVR